MSDGTIDTSVYGEDYNPYPTTNLDPIDSLRGTPMFVLKSTGNYFPDAGKFHENVLASLNHPIFGFSVGEMWWKMGDTGYPYHYDGMEAPIGAGLEIAMQEQLRDVNQNLVPHSPISINGMTGVNNMFVNIFSKFSAGYNSLNYELGAFAHSFSPSTVDLRKKLSTGYSFNYGAANFFNELRHQQVRRFTMAGMSFGSTDSRIEELIEDGVFPTFNGNSIYNFEEGYWNRMQQDINVNDRFTYGQLYSIINFCMLLGAQWDNTSGVADSFYHPEFSDVDEAITRLLNGRFNPVSNWSNTEMFDNPSIAIMGDRRDRLGTFFKLHYFIKDELGNSFYGKIIDLDEEGNLKLFTFNETENAWLPTDVLTFNSGITSPYTIHVWEGWDKLSNLRVRHHSVNLEDYMEWDLEQNFEYLEDMAQYLADNMLFTGTVQDEGYQKSFANNPQSIFDFDENWDGEGWTTDGVGNPNSIFQLLTNDSILFKFTKFSGLGWASRFETSGVRNSPDPDASYGTNLQWQASNWVDKAAFHYLYGGVQFNNLGIKVLQDLTDPEVRLKIARLIIHKESRGEYYESEVASEWDSSELDFSLGSWPLKGVYGTYHQTPYERFPDNIYILDSQARNKYHKLKIRATVAELGNNGQEHTNVIVQNDLYNDDSSNDVGWDEQRMGEKILSSSDVDFDPVFMPDSNFVLKDLWAQENNRKQFVWESANFDLGNQTVNKILSKIKVVYKNSPPKIEYKINGEDFWKKVLSSNLNNEGYCLTYKFPKEDKKAKSIQIRLSSSKNIDESYDTEVDSFCIIYRERGNA